MKIPQWWWDIEDTIIKVGFWACMAGIAVIGLYVLCIAIETTPGFFRAAGIIS